MNNKSSVMRALLQSGLSEEEATVYIALHKEIATHLALSRTTGINRTKVYRIVQQLEQRGLVARQTDDRGTFLRACDVGVLELELSALEQQTREQRALVHSIVPVLQELHNAPLRMTVRTYEGAEGFKQMCWHELKAQGELFALGGGTIEDMIPNRYWAQKHRQLNVEADYKVFEIVNNLPDRTFTDDEEFMQLYACRVLPESVLKIANQTTIYNNTVSIYHWSSGHKTGLEIIDAGYAAMMRQLFKSYWALAKPLPSYEFDQLEEKTIQNKIR